MKSENDIMKNKLSFIPDFLIRQKVWKQKDVLQYKNIYKSIPRSDENNIPIETFTCTTACFFLFYNWPTHMATTLALCHMLHNGKWQNKETACRGMTRSTRCGQTGATAVNQGVSHKLQQVPNIKHKRHKDLVAALQCLLWSGWSGWRHSTCVDVVDSEHDLLMTDACAMRTKVVVNVDE